MNSSPLLWPSLCLFFRSRQGLLDGCYDAPLGHSLRRIPRSKRRCAARPLLRTLVPVASLSRMRIYFGGGVLSKLGTSAGIWWKGCLSTQKIAAWGRNHEWSSKVPIFKTNMPGRGGLLTQTWVPQLPQKYLTRGSLKSLLAKVLNSPCVTVKVSSEITIEALGSPPER